MRFSKTLLSTTAIASAFAIGVVLSGSLSSASADRETSNPATVSLGNFAKELPPHEVLGNGQTAGDWRLEDPPSKWPDFIPVLLEDGTSGYVRFEDMNGIPLSPSISESTRSEIDRREPGASLIPDEQGAIWADVYDQSGKNVIGKWLVSTSAE